ncbi:MAG TPA: SRPBCC family protein [Methylophilaceae bacterium]|jgi:mxaD protein
MKKSLSLVALLAMAFSVNVFAAPAKTLSVKESVELNAPADVVWAKVNNFGDLGAWHPAVAKTEITAGTNNEKGAVRVLTLQDGGKITEKLRAYNGKKMSYEYEIVEGVLPVSHYVSTITVKADGKDKSVVVWVGHFKRKDTAATPAAGQDDETAVKTITGVYKGGLDNLKKLVEAK